VTGTRRSSTRDPRTSVVETLLALLLLGATTGLCCPDWPNARPASCRVASEYIHTSSSVGILVAPRGPFDSLQRGHRRAVAGEPLHPERFTRSLQEAGAEQHGPQDGVNPAAGTTR
jgi:hypothetical protein